MSTKEPSSTLAVWIIPASIIALVVSLWIVSEVIKATQVPVLKSSPQTFEQAGNGGWFRK